MGRGPNAPVRLQALKEAFLKNAALREWAQQPQQTSALSLWKVAEASGLDVRRALGPIAQNKKSALMRTQG